MVEADWDKLISINLRGTMLCFKYAAQQMISQGKGGCLIGLSLRFRLQFRLDSLLVAASSVAGRKGMGYLLPSNSCPRTKSFVGHPLGSAYSASKFAVRGLVQSSGILKYLSFSDIGILIS